MSSGFNSGAIDPALLITTTHPNHNNTSTTTNSQPSTSTTTTTSTSTSTSNSTSTSTSTSTTINPSQLNLNPRSSTVDPSHPDHHHHHHHHHLLLPLRSQPSNPTSGAGALINSSLVFPLTSSTIDQPSSSLPPTHPNPNSSSSSLGPPSSSSLPLHHHHHPPPPTPSSLNLPPSQSSIPPTIPSNSDPTLLNGSTTPTQSNLPNLRDETSSNQEQEMHQKDQELAQFLLRMEDYKPVIPDRVAAYYLSKVGFESTDLNVQRLLVLACQKFISDIAQDAFSYARTRTGQAPGSRQGPLAPLSNSAGLSTALPNHPGTRKDRTRTVLTQEDLAQALAEYGINASRAPYYL